MFHSSHPNIHPSPPWDINLPNSATPAYPTACWTYHGEIDIDRDVEGNDPTYLLTPHRPPGPHPSDPTAHSSHSGPATYSITYPTELWNPPGPATFADPPTGWSHPREIDWEVEGGLVHPMIPYHSLPTSSLYCFTNSGHPNPAAYSTTHPTELWNPPGPATFADPQGEVDNEQEGNGRVEVCQTQPCEHPFTPQTSSPRKQSPQPSLPPDGLSPIPCKGTIQRPGASSSKRQNIILSVKWSSSSPSHAKGQPAKRFSPHSQNLMAPHCVASTVRQKAFPQAGEKTCLLSPQSKRTEKTLFSL